MIKWALNDSKLIRLTNRENKYRKEYRRVCGFGMILIVNILLTATRFPAPGISYPSEPFVENTVQKLGRFSD